ncbi:AAA family ATPase [Thermaurantiacus sp.]
MGASQDRHKGEDPSAPSASGGLGGFARRSLRRLAGGEAEPAAAVSRLPRFAVAATEELADVRPVAGRVHPERARLALADALAASQPVTSRERFAGRTDVLSDLISAIEQQRAHVVLYGERGIGKTSLAHVFAETARDARYLVLYGSCGVEASFDDMFRSFAAQIPLLYHADVSPVADEREHQRSFVELVDSNPLDPRSLAELFARIVGTRVILILDEYDRVRDPAFRRDVAELIKNLSDRAARVQLVLTGVASNLDELVGFTPSIRRNIVGIGVGPMADADMAFILDRAEAATGLIFLPDARARVLRMAAGSPYLVRLIGSRAALRALDARRAEVTAEDVTAGTEAVLSEWSSGLPSRVQRLLARADVRADMPLLIAAAKASGTPEGWFAPEDLAGVVLSMDGAMDVAAIASRLAALARESDLFEAQAETSDGPREQRYRFRTQGVAQLLNLSAALARGDS